ncbi:MAG TPA: glycosyltransferase family 39 protein [Candidatus Koribacter sp.]|jgi:mannosyltransferase
MRMPVAQDNQATSRERLTIIFLTIAAFTLRLAFLGHKSLWLDEAASYSLCRLPWREFLSAWWAHEANMTAYYALQRAWLHLGTNEFMLRLPSAIFGTLAVPAIYRLARRLFNANVGLVAALLLAVNPAHLEYSQEARSYPMVIFFVLLAAEYLLRALGTSAWLDWTLFVLFATLAVYSHFFAALVFAAFFLALFARTRASLDWQRTLIAFFAFGILISPAMFFVLFRGQTMDLYWLSPVGASSFWKLFQFFIGSGAKLIISLILFIAGLWALSQQSRSLNVFLLSWLLLPIAITFLASLHHNIFSYKYLLICLPALLLLCALGASFLPRYAGWGLVGILVVASLITDVAGYKKPREDWRALNQYVVSSYHSGDAIAFYPPYARNPFDYYHQRTGPAELQIAAPNVIGGDLKEDVYDIAHPEQMVRGLSNPRIWVVLYGNRSEGAQMLNALPNGYTPRMEKDFSGIALRLYAR